MTTKKYFQILLIALIVLHPGNDLMAARNPPGTEYLRQSIEQGKNSEKWNPPDFQEFEDLLNSQPSSFTGAARPAPKSEKEVIELLERSNKDENAFVRTLLERNPDLLAARANKQAVDLEIPQATALEITLSQYEGFLKTGGVTIPIPGLFPFPGIMTQKLGIARANATIAREQTRMSERMSVTMAAEVIVKVWYLKNLEKLLVENLALAQDIRELAMRLYKDGKVEFADAVGARVRQDTIRTKLVEVRNNLKIVAAKGAALLDLKNLSLEAIPYPARLLKFAEPKNLKVLQKQGEKHREELLILDSRLKKIDHLLGMIARMTTPDLAFSSSLPMLQGSGNIRRMGGPKGKQPSLMIRSNPAFGFFQAIIGQMQALRLKVKHLSQSMTRKIQSEIEEQFAQYETSKKTLVITRGKILPDLKASVRSLMTLYQNGRTTFADLAQGEIRWLDARHSELNAGRDLLFATARLISAQGITPLQEAMQ